MPALPQAHRGDLWLGRRSGERHAPRSPVWSPSAGGLKPHRPAQASWGGGVSVPDLWRIIDMPDYTDDDPDMMELAYCLFEDHGSGEFAVGCVTGQIFHGGDTDAVDFSWTGNDEIDEAQGDGCPPTPVQRLPEGPNLLPRRRRSRLRHPPLGFFKSLLAAFAPGSAVETLEASRLARPDQRRLPLSTHGPRLRGLRIRLCRKRRRDRQRRPRHRPDQSGTHRWTWHTCPHRP